MKRSRYWIETGRRATQGERRGHGETQKIVVSEEKMGLEYRRREERHTGVRTNIFVNEPYLIAPLQWCRIPVTAPSKPCICAGPAAAERVTVNSTRYQPE